MIELTWGQIREPGFNHALRKLFQAPLDFSTGLKVVSLVKLIDKEKELCAPLLDKHIDLYYKKENNEVKGLKDGVDTAKEETAAKEITGHKFRVKLKKIAVDQVSRAQLSPQEILWLEPVLDIKDIEETDDEVVPAKPAPLKAAPEATP